MPKTKVPPQPRLRLKLAHDLKEARVAGRRVREWISSHGVADLKTRDCELAVVESCNNAIQHSSRAGRSQPIYVEAQWQADCIEFQVIDSSAPWEFPNDPSLPPAENETGRGLFLIRRLMDEVSVQHRGGMNFLIARKRLARP